MPPSGPIPRESAERAPEARRRLTHPGLTPATTVDARDIHVLVELLPCGSAARRARTVIREVLRRDGLDDEAVTEAEIIVGELAANAERHARPPFELRVFHVDGVPIWCEIIDGDPEAEKIRSVFELLSTLPEPDLSLYAESGRGLLMAFELSQGHCQAYPTTTISTNAPGKAVAFALPTTPTTPPSTT